MSPVSCILFHFYIKPQLVSCAEHFVVVVSYSISTSNHNLAVMCIGCKSLYLIPFLHQTTTTRPILLTTVRCILFHFYIKPQPLMQSAFSSIVVSYSISTSNHNYKIRKGIAINVVSYSISTSNHNLAVMSLGCKSLYLIPFLHQTTTHGQRPRQVERCILFHFYIKPQPCALKAFCSRVVSYSISTSNHNVLHPLVHVVVVVSYSISTSNHNT